MDASVKILAVAPYEGLASVLEREAQRYDNVEMTVVVGNLEEGVTTAINHLTEPYDLILSRGGTADLLREALDLPVIDIKTSVYDVLQAVQLSEGIQGKRAVVGFAGITDAARNTSDVLQLDLDIFTLTGEGDVHQMIEPLRRGGYTTILCDVISSTVFRESGFSTVLVTSGVRSVRESLEEGIRMARLLGSAHTENLLLRDIIGESGIDTVVFNENGSLFFTTLDRADSKAMLDVLKELLHEALCGYVEVVRRTIEGRHYSIKTSVHTMNGVTKVAFFVSQSGSVAATRQAGIAYHTKTEARRIYLESPYSLTGEATSLSRVINDTLSSGKPLLVTGEYGTGRTAIADYAYANSRFSARPLAEIDCGMLTDRSRANLLSGRTSPLFESGMTIHLKNMEVSDPSFITELFSTMDSTGVTLRNAVIFSCNPRGELVNSYLPYIKDRFQCVEIALPPLRESKERIPTLAKLYLSQLSADLPREVQRIDREALELLTEYSWPGNYIQFQRVFSQLCIISRDHVVRAADVRSVFALERPVYPGASQPTGYAFDLDRTLEEIESDIVSLAIDRHKGNQSAAARQLGISRTTLWRMVRGRKGSSS